MSSLGRQFIEILKATTKEITKQQGFVVPLLFQYFIRVLCVFRGERYWILNLITSLAGAST